MQPSLLNCAVHITRTSRCRILVEAFTVLLPQPLSVDHSFQQDGWAVLGVTRALVEGLLDGKAGVEADATDHISAPSKARRLKDLQVGCGHATRSARLEVEDRKRT